MALHAEEEQINHQSRERLDHLQLLHEIPSVADVAYDNWSRVRLSRLLVDYLLRNGYEESARSLAESSGIKDLVDIEEFIAARRIERSLLAGKTADCLSWCSENKTSLKKMNSNLEVELRLQEYIELLRTRDTANIIKATRHAQKYLTPHGDTESTFRAAGMLAISPRIPLEPYKSLYAPQRWHRLAELFIKTHHNLLGLPHDPPLFVALTAGLSVLKTPSCHSTHVSPSSALNAAASPVMSHSNKDGTTTNGERLSRPAGIGQSVCPICSTELNSLAKAVPYAHQTKSIVDSDLVVLPNGRVYGREKLMAFQANVGNVPLIERDEDSMEGIESAVIRDPADPEQVFGRHEIKRVYIS